MNSLERPSVFLPHGGYRHLRSYKLAEAVYDATVVFCRRFFARDHRMADQRVQAARSGVRNISEGSGAAATSRKSEMLLTNVARASLSDPSDKPRCPKCGKPMLQRTARKGSKAGQPFWGCSGFPDCTGALPAGSSDESDSSDERPKKTL